MINTDIIGWIDGPAPTLDTNTKTIMGRLARYVVVNPEHLVAAPASLSPVEASTLPCANQRQYERDRHGRRRQGRRSSDWDLHRARCRRAVNQPGHRDHALSTTRSPSPSFGMACTGPEPLGCGGKPLKVASASRRVRQPGRSELVGEWHRERLWNGRCWRKADIDIS